MEKRGVIEPERTPDTEACLQQKLAENAKQAGQQPGRKELVDLLDDDATKRLSDAASK